MGNGDYNTENLNLETQFPWRTGTEPCGLWAFQALDPPGEPRWVQGAPKLEGWAGGPQLREKEALASDRPCPQTTPAQPRPLPGRGSLQAFFLSFFFNLRNFVLSGFWGSLSPGRL